MRYIAPLLAIPIIIGMIAAIAGVGEPTIRLLISLFKIGEWVLVVLILFKIVQFLFSPFISNGDIHEKRTTLPDYIHPSRDMPLDGGYVERIDRSTMILYADGYAFEMKNINSRLHWREINPRSRRPLEDWIHSASGNSEVKVAREHITMRINKRKGL